MALSKQTFLGLKLITLNEGGVRKEFVSGRNYLVVPVSMIVSGVLNGSNGPLYYDPSELGINPDGWNYMPIVIDHPRLQDGTEISARSPDVLADRGIGNLYNVTYEDKLKGEGWIDEERVKNLSPKIYNKIINDLPIEISTGITADYDPAPEGSSYNGILFTHIVRNIKPDHLAILTSEQGACSNKDGCGMGSIFNQACVSSDRSNDQANRDSDSTDCTCENKPPISNKIGQGTHRSSNKKGQNMVVKKLTANQRKSLVSKIINNCGGKDSLNQKRKNQLNLLPDTQLQFLLKSTNNAEDGEGDGETAGVDIKALAEFLGVDIDASQDPAGFVNMVLTKLDEIRSKLSGPEPAPAQDTTMGSGEEDDETMNDVQPPAPDESLREETTRNKKGKVKGAVNLMDKPVGQLTAQEFMQVLPAPIKEVIANAQTVMDDQRETLINQLVSNSRVHGDPALEQALRNALAKKPIPELKILADALGVQTPTTPQGQNANDLGDQYLDFLGAGSPIVNRGAGANGGYRMDDEPLVVPSLFE